MRVCNIFTSVCTQGLWAENDIYLAKKSWTRSFGFCSLIDVPPKFCHLFLKATVTDIFNYFKPYSNSTMLDKKWGGYIPLEISNSYGDVTISGKVLQLLTNTPYSLPFSSGASLVWQIYCHTGHPSSNSYTHTDTHICCWEFSSNGDVTSCFNYLELSRSGFEHQTIRMWSEPSTPPLVLTLLVKNAFLTS